jgi:hypothetical protein
MPPLDEQTIETIDVLVRSAFYGHDEIVEMLCEELYAPGELDEEAVSRATTASIENWRASQASWPAVTDCDRLDRAFARLNQLGVIALHNAGFTQSDGYDDFREAYANHPHPSDVLGYCFYHGQDLERVVRGGPLLFGFGPSDPNAEQSDGLKVSRLIVEQLTAAGLAVDWDGTFDNRISVPKFNWQRRGVPRAR